MLNRGPETWDGKPLPHDYVEEVINAHRSGDDFSFRRRPLTTWCVDAISQAGFTPKIAFIAWSLMMFFISGVLVHRLALEFGSTVKQANSAQALFHLSPTVLFAWFDPMYTYDEPIQYAALLSGLLAMLLGRTLLSIIALTVALIAHETSLFLLPLFAIMLRHAPGRMLLMMATPAMLFVVFLFTYLPSQGLIQPSVEDTHNRLGTWAFNFSSPAMAAETVGYALMTLLLPVYLLTRYQKHAVGDTSIRLVMPGFWITLVLNTAVVLIAAKAREARVLALPLIIAWPWMGNAFAAELERLGGWRELLRFMRSPVSLLTFIAAAVLVGFAVYNGFVLSTGIPQDNPWHEYLLLESLLVIALMLADRNRRSSGLHAA